MLWGYGDFVCLILIKVMGLCYHKKRQLMDIEKYKQI